MQTKDPKTPIFHIPPGADYNTHLSDNRRQLLASLRRNNCIEKGEANTSVMQSANLFRKKMQSQQFHTLSSSKSEPAFSKLGLVEEEEDEDKQEEETGDNCVNMSPRQQFIRVSISPSLNLIVVL